MNKLAILLVLVLSSVLILNLVACGNDEEEATVNPLGQTVNAHTPEPQVIEEPVEIIIGNLTDITGVSANAQLLVNRALDDIVEYYNSENLIPGVELKVITYDTQFDPSKDIHRFLSTYHLSCCCWDQADKHRCMPQNRPQQNGRLWLL